MHAALLAYIPEPHCVCIQEEPGPEVGGLRHGLQVQSSLYQKSTLGSHRPKPFSNVAQWLREASIVHALPKRESLGSTLPTLWG